jgi:outer membrane protein TolC
VARNEVETAYFTLLRAREDLAALRRYEDYLGEEARRIRRFVSEGEALADTVDVRLRRVLRHTDTPLADALKARLALLADEAARLPDRLVAAESYVEECEREHERLRGRT